MIQLFQQRDFGKKINATFQYISQNFRSLGLSLLYIAGPVALVAGIATGVMQSNMVRLISESANARTNDFAAAFQLASFFSSPSYWLTVFFSLLANVAVILTTYAHMKVYNRVQGTPIQISDVWTEVQPVIGRGILISILNTIITSVGFAFLFIPGIYLAVVLSLSLAVTSFEGTDFGATWNRCFQLIRDKWWSTFGLIITMIFIVFIVLIVFAILAGIIANLTGAKLLPTMSVAWLMVGNAISLVGKTILNVVIYIAIGFQYTNLVERHEGRGMISAIDSIGTTPTQPRATDEGTY